MSFDQNVSLNENLKKKIVGQEFSDFNVFVSHMGSC